MRQFAVFTPRNYCQKLNNGNLAGTPNSLGSLVGMELHVVINGRKDLAGQLYQQLRAAIESGRLAAGTQLPPSRLLAEQLGISRKTISDTYAQLTYENFLTGVVGKGTYVNARTSKVQHKQRHCE